MIILFACFNSCIFCWDKCIELKIILCIMMPILKKSVNLLYLCFRIFIKSGYKAFLHWVVNYELIIYGIYLRFWWQLLGMPTECLLSGVFVYIMSSSERSFFFVFKNKNSHLQNININHYQFFLYRGGVVVRFQWHASECEIAVIPPLRSFPAIVSRHRFPRTSS